MSDVPLPEPKRMKFADVCALMPEGVYWGDGLTPEIARRLVEAGHAHAAAVSAAENARLHAAIRHYEAALKEVWPEGAKGKSFEHWNAARKILESVDAPPTSS
jgi:hypothetical protein